MSVQDLKAEILINRIRLLSILIFYGIHLLNFYGFDFLGIQIRERDDITPQFHTTVTWAILGWFLTSGLVSTLIKNGIYWNFLKYYTTAVDVLLITFFLYLGDGPKSSLIVIYYLILASCSLRLHLDVIRFCSISIILGWSFIVWHTVNYRPEFTMSFGVLSAQFLSLLILAFMEMKRICMIRGKA